jgi:glutaredoxin
MKTVIFFGNRACPFCQRVLYKLEKTNTTFEFNEVPMERSVRGMTIYTGPSPDLKGKLFKEIFNGDISIPKMIVDGQKIMDSQDMINILNS